MRRRSCLPERASACCERLGLQPLQEREETEVIAAAQGHSRRVPGDARIGRPRVAPLSTLLEMSILSLHKAQPLVSPLLQSRAGAPRWGWVPQVPSSASGREPFDPGAGGIQDRLERRTVELTRWSRTAVLACGVQARTQASERRDR